MMIQAANTCEIAVVCVCNMQKKKKTVFFDVKMRSESAGEIAGRRMKSCGAAAAPPQITAAAAGTRIRIWSCRRIQMTERLDIKSNLRDMQHGSTFLIYRRVTPSVHEADLLQLPPPPKKKPFEKHVYLFFLELNWKDGLPLNTRIFVWDDYVIAPL